MQETRRPVLPAVASDLRSLTLHLFSRGAEQLLRPLALRRRAGHADACLRQLPQRAAPPTSIRQAVARFRAALGDRPDRRRRLLLRLRYPARPPTSVTAFESNLKKERAPRAARREPGGLRRVRRRRPRALRPPRWLRDGRAVPAHRGVGGRGGPRNQIRT